MALAVFCIYAVDFAINGGECGGCGLGLGYEGADGMPL